MSLLMDALKKAELAKRQGQAEDAGESAEAQGGLALEPMPTSSPAQPAAELSAAQNAAPAENLPHLPSHLEELDAQFLAEAKQAATARLKARAAKDSGREPSADHPAKGQPRATAAAEQRRARAGQEDLQSRSAAQNVFAAKQADKPPARNTFAIAIGILTFVAICGIGGYFWWQVQPKTILVASRGPLSPAPSFPPAALPAPTLATPSVSLPPGAPSAAPAASPVAANKPADAAAEPAKAPPQSARAVAPPAPHEDDLPIRVTRVPLKVDPALLRGFDAFNRGDLAAAQIEYERAQKTDPRNTDALHGLAAIAVRQGRLNQAEWLYQQIIEADPQDTVAMAALINGRAQIDPSAAESRLKSLSAAQPELAAPHFSLGNLYARQGRWSDAQQAYFRAYNAEPQNPDILYNLAISLEHLRQNKLAAQYYSEAIAAAQNRPAGFDKAQASARLNTLRP